MLYCLGYTTSIRCPKANPRYLIKPRFSRACISFPSRSDDQAPKAPDSGLARIRQSVDGLGYLSAAARNLSPLPDIFANQIVYRLHAPVTPTVWTHYRIAARVSSYFSFIPRIPAKQALPCTKLLIRRTVLIFISCLFFSAIHVEKLNLPILFILKIKITVSYNFILFYIFIF